MNEDGPAYSFRCLNLDCDAQYVAIPKGRAPDKKPRCEHCDAPFMAKHKGRYIHYQSLRFD
jgi:ribosomal protein S27AE